MLSLIEQNQEESACLYAIARQLYGNRMFLQSFRTQSLAAEQAAYEQQLRNNLTKDQDK